LISTCARLTGGHALQYRLHVEIKWSSKCTQLDYLLLSTIPWLWS